MIELYATIKVSVSIVITSDEMTYLRSFPIMDFKSDTIKSIENSLRNEYRTLGHLPKLIKKAVIRLKQS